MHRIGLMKLGAILHGVGGTVSGWRHPEAVDASTDFETYRRWARTAEDGRLDLLFITDTAYITADSTPQYLSQFEPIALLSALASVTSRIGLVGTVSTTYSEPFTIARQIATLDHVSGGRAGINIVTTGLPGTALNYGRTEREHPDHDLRYEIADEYLDVVSGLWDSWGGDAFAARDKATGVFFDRSKLHTLAHEGRFFSVKGPLNVARPPQGQPVIFQAGASEAGRDYAAKRSDGVFLGPSTMDEAGDFYRDIKRRAAAHGRDVRQVHVLNALRPFLGDTPEDAERRYLEVAELEDIGHALSYLSMYFGNHDFTQYDLATPFAEIGEGLSRENFQFATDSINAQAQKYDWTLREVALRYTTPKGEWVGTPEQVADRMQQWWDAEVTDGFLLLDVTPGGIERFVEQVVPLLQERGVFKREYASETLRGHFGLDVPPNRFA
jgi:FMN-dependent oxidoreductase (nitrilotriacetate monooxygenase family)